MLLNPGRELFLYFELSNLADGFSSKAPFIACCLHSFSYSSLRIAVNRSHISSDLLCTQAMESDKSRSSNRPALLWWLNERRGD
jgi:hypothetical protein